MSRGSRDGAAAGEFAPRRHGAASNTPGLIALATRRPVAVIMIVMAIVLFGALSFRRLPRNLMPDISYPSVTVRTRYPGASPLEVETRVTRRLEEALAQVRGLRKISSISRAEASDVILELAWKTDMSLAVMDVRERLEQVVLPDEVVKPTILRYDPTLDPILQLGLLRRVESGDGLDQEMIDLRLLAEDHVERELEKADEVAAVQVLGGLEREFRIDVDEGRLRQFGVDMALINERLAQENLNQPSGMLYNADRSLVVRTVNEFESIDEIRDIILRREGAVPVRLLDVASVTSSYEEPDVITRINGRPCVKIAVFKEADANLVDVAMRVRNAVYGTAAQQRRWKTERARSRDDPGESVSEASESSGGDPSRRGAHPNFLAARLPDDVEIVVMSDQSVFIVDALEDLRRSAVVGAFLAVGVLLLFLRKMWFTVAIGLSIPVSVVATFIGFYLFDVSVNMMSLGGLALGIGMLVDNSIVVLESIFRCREEGDGVGAAAVRGAREVASAVTASTLTTVAVFFPIVFVEGVAGQVFRDQALAVVFSLFASLIVALFLIPAVVGRERILQANDETRRLFRFRRELVILFRNRIDALVEACWRRQGMIVRCFSVWIVFVGSVFVVAVSLISIVFELLRLLWVYLLYGITRLVMAAVRIVGWPFRFAGVGLGRVFADVSHVARRRYEQLLRACLAHRSYCLAVVFVCVLMAWHFFRLLGAELIPEVHQGEFSVELRLPIGTRIERASEILMPLERRIESLRLKHAGAAVGAAGGATAAPRGIDRADGVDRPGAALEASGGDGFEALGRIETLTATIGVEREDVQSGDEGPHTARFAVRLKAGPNAEVAEDEVKAALRRLLSSESHLSSVRFEPPVLFSFRTPIEVEVRGYDLSELRRLTTVIEERLRGIRQLKDVRTHLASGYPEVHLKLDRDLMSRHGLTVAEVGQRLRRKLEGEVPTFFSSGDRKIGMRVRLREDDRQTVEQLEELIVHADASRPYRLADIAEITLREGPSEIRRVDQQRAGIISANLRGINLGAAVEQIAEAVRGIEREPGFGVGFSGQKEEMEASRAALFRALVLAVFLVYVVLAVQFESLMLPLVIICTVPLGMLSVSPVLSFLGLTLNIVTMIGLIVLSGIVVNNAIVLVDRIHRSVRAGHDPTEAIVEGALLRARPILMTTLTTMLGLLPLTGIFNNWPILADFLGRNAGGEIRLPLAVTVMAGLIGSTLLTLVVIPVVYSLLARASRSSESEIVEGAA